MIIDSHMRNPIRGDVALSRFESLGEEGQIILAGLKPGDCGLNENDLTQFRLMVNAPVVSASTPVVPVPTTTAPEEDKGKSNIGMILLLCLVSWLLVEPWFTSCYCGSPNKNNQHQCPGTGNESPGATHGF